MLPYPMCTEIYKEYVSPTDLFRSFCQCILVDSDTRSFLVNPRNLHGRKDSKDTHLSLKVKQINIDHGPCSELKIMSIAYIYILHILIYIHVYIFVHAFVHIMLI